MIARGANFKSYPIDVVGGSQFGRYPKVNPSYSLNMFISDNWFVNYPGYQAFIFNLGLGVEGRGIHTSTILNKIVAVVDNVVYLISLNFDQTFRLVQDVVTTVIGHLASVSGPVYIAENNKPQIAISDGKNIYIYDPSQSTPFQVPKISFTPGYIDFHDTYFLVAATNDTAVAATIVNNSWRLSASNNGLSWPDDPSHIGLLQTKPDTTQAVVRVPSKGNMIFVMGRTVTEFWFDTASQIFPYQRNQQGSIDYGCLNPATIAALDEMVVWLGFNEKSGPIILYSTGGMPEKITTDGIDYLFSNMQNPADSRAFLFRQDGHLIYHINFYTDNVSLFYDFNTGKFFHASDENRNYFIGNCVAFYNNQYYMLSINDANLYAFDTTYTTYSGKEIPRIRICSNIREKDQQYRVINDIGFTIETGETDYQNQNTGPEFLVTMSGNYLITTGHFVFLTDMLGNILSTISGNELVATQTDPTDFDNLIAVQNGYVNTTPRVDLSISYDGGATFGNDFSYILPAIGQRKNKLMWWQCGISNDVVPQFKFWGLGRFVAYDGEANLRQ